MTNRQLIELLNGIGRSVAGDSGISAEVSRPAAGFGDFSTNLALQLAPRLGRPPRQLAEEIARRLSGEPELSQVQVAGPGFINLTLSDASLLKGLETATAKAAAGESETVVIETYNMNPFKDLHIGHAYNCVVADTLANLLEAAGRRVHRVSYHGDVGAHVGKSMWSLLKFIEGKPERLQEVDPKRRGQFMGKMYAEGAAAYRQDPAATAAIDKLAGLSFDPGADPLFQRVYQTCLNWSFDYIENTVARLGGVRAEKRYLESQANSVGVATVKRHLGRVFRQSEGAVVFDKQRSGLHTEVFISRDGRGLYAARDLGLIELKQRDFHPNKSLIVTGDEQRNYFKVVIKAAEAAMPELKGVTVNIPTGLVKLTSGKMSSRTGEVLNIEWLFDQLDQATRRQGAEPSEQTIVGALRYAMLKVRIGSDVVFDVNGSVSVEGNSGPYLQYAHARARSILSKAGPRAAARPPESLDKAERLLARKLSEFDEVLNQAAEEMMPHGVAAYLYELAQEFNRFYEKCRVIGDPRSPGRLWLVERYAETLRRGLAVLGIPSPDRL
ncbi:MAG: arginine--tRNA ligase [Candidatus Chaera renei]|uniref:Arginine--tRNA ligase n=1 Tax=Candidatus Chaera renei TaxID=2506947 RepID=A0A4Q0AIU8_9BACT|nr:MAG: arginine--tRNA ligase [Candidatus Chaera renei]